MNQTLANTQTGRSGFVDVAHLQEKEQRIDGASRVDGDTEPSPVTPLPSLLDEPGWPTARATANDMVEGLRGATSKPGEVISDANSAATILASVTEMTPQQESSIQGMAGQLNMEVGLTWSTQECLSPILSVLYLC